MPYYTDFRSLNGNKDGCCCKPDRCQPSEGWAGRKVIFLNILSNESLFYNLGPIFIFSLFKKRKDRKEKAREERETGRRGHWSTRRRLKACAQSTWWSTIWVLIDIWSCKSSLKLDSSHSVDLERLAEVQDHIGLEGNAPRGEALMDGLRGEADLAEDPQLVPVVGELCVLQVSHLDAKVPHEVVVNQGGGWCW